MTNLMKCLKLFNWNGGTHTQVNQELARVICQLKDFKDARFDVVSMNEVELDQAIYLYSVNQGETK